MSLGNNNVIADDGVVVINFINSNNEDELKELYKKLTIFDDYIDWSEMKEEDEKIVPFGTFYDYKIDLDVDCKMLYLKRYLYNDGYLVIEDVIFRKNTNRDNGYFFAMFSFDTLYNVKEDMGSFMINRLVSREISYNGRNFSRNAPIYYGENYSCINNNEEAEVLRKVLTK